MKRAHGRSYLGQTEAPAGDLLKKAFCSRPKKSPEGVAILLQALFCPFRTWMELWDKPAVATQVSGHKERREVPPICFRNLPSHVLF